MPFSRSPSFLQLFQYKFLTIKTATHSGVEGEKTQPQTRIAGLFQDSEPYHNQTNDEYNYRNKRIILGNESMTLPQFSEVASDLESILV